MFVTFRVKLCTSVRTPLDNVKVTTVGPVLEKVVGVNVKVPELKAMNEGRADKDKVGVYPLGSE